MMKIRTEWLIKMGLILFAGLLYLIFGRRKPKYQDLEQCMENPFGKYVLYAFAIMIAAFAAWLIATISADDSAWEQGGAMMVLVFVLLFLLAVLLVLGGLKIGKHYAYYNEEKIILGKLFGADRTFYWYELSEVRLTRKGERLRLYDQAGKKVLDADNRMAYYYQLRDMVVKTCGARVVSG